jgi:hypothetical protein
MYTLVLKADGNYTRREKHWNAEVFLFTLGWRVSPLLQEKLI